MTTRDELAGVWITLIHSEDDSGKIDLVLNGRESHDRSSNQQSRRQNNRGYSSKH